jgi:hypothetical protein
MRTEGDTPTTSLGVVVMVPCAAFAPSSSAADRGIVLVERPRMEGSSAHGAGVEPSQILVRMGTNRP